MWILRDGNHPIHKYLTVYMMFHVLQQLWSMIILEGFGAPKSKHSSCSLFLFCFFFFFRHNYFSLYPNKECNQGGKIKNNYLPTKKIDFWNCKVLPGSKDWRGYQKYLSFINVFMFVKKNIPCIWVYLHYKCFNKQN